MRNPSPELKLSIFGYRGPFTTLYRVDEPYPTTDWKGRTVVVPVGTIADGASFPWWLKFLPLLLVFALLALGVEEKTAFWSAILAQSLIGFPMHRAYAKAAVVHDYLYSIGAGRIYADRFFFVLMVREAFALYYHRNGRSIPHLLRGAVLVYRLVRAGIMFAAVFAFGFFAYAGHRRRRVRRFAAARERRKSTAE